MGNHPNIVMTSDKGDYDFETFESMSSLVKNNLLTDPKFTDVSIDYNLTPEKFNFDYLSDSPAKNHGITTDAPSTDLRSNPRDEKPDAGCYEYEYLPQNLTILTSAILPEATQNQSFSQTLKASGGNPPYTWQLTSGTLPNGLNLNSSTGIISGTPTQTGTFTFAIQVKDSNNNTSTKEFTLTVNPAQLPGDLNQDNKVNSQDFQILIQKFKESQNIENEDLNSDGIVDVKDIGILMHYWKE